MLGAGSELQFLVSKSHTLHTKPPTFLPKKFWKFTVVILMTTRGRSSGKCKQSLFFLAGTVSFLQ